MIENEFKVMLNVEQYEKLLAMYEWDEVINQVNHYYDNKDLVLAERHITCRVREIGKKFVLQMKHPVESQDPKEYSRIEREMRLQRLPDSIKVPPEFDPKEMGELIKLGSLKTTRNVFKFEGGEIDLDKSEYFGITDYEVEIEFTDENNARKMLEEIKQKLGIEPNSLVCAGKVRRFLEAYLKSKKGS